MAAAAGGRSGVRHEGRKGGKKEGTKGRNGMRRVRATRPVHHRDYKWSDSSGLTVRGCLLLLGNSRGGRATGSEARCANVIKRQEAGNVLSVGRAMAETQFSSVLVYSLKISETVL